MKKMILFIAPCILICSFAFVPLKNIVVGKWKITYKSGMETFIEFRKNETFKTEIPSENFTIEGKYKIKNDMVYITDTSCGGNYWGKYKVTVISNDSVYTEVLEDSCTGRRVSADKTFLVRIKN